MKFFTFVIVALCMVAVPRAFAGVGCDKLVQDGSKAVDCSQLAGSAKTTCEANAKAKPSDAKALK